jgi:hypothetical protein
MTELLLSEFRLYAQDVAALCLCAAALIWGGGPERMIAIVWFVLFRILPQAYWLSVGTGVKLATIDPLVAAWDTIATVIFVAIALNANRNWPLWVAGLQVLALLAHVARGLTDIIAPIAYAVMFAAPGWLQLVIIGIGITRHARRRATYGPYRDWRVPVRLGGLLAVPVSRR